MIPRSLGKFSADRVARAARRAAPAVPDSIDALRSKSKVAGDKTVIVAGAGAAGLSAAYELQQLGFNVCVLEADAQHIGGRIRTLRFDEQRYAEAGAMRIPQDHDLTRFYVGECGLRLRDFVQTNEQAFVRLRDKRVRLADKQQLFDEFLLTTEERELGDDGIWEKAVLSVVESLTEADKADLYRDRPQSDRVDGLDAQSLRNQFWKAKLSHEAIQLMGSLWNLETSLHISFTEHLREELEGTWINPFSEIVGGMDSLPKAMAARLSQPVHFSHQVTAITRTADRVTAHVNTPEGSKEFSGDWLICTLPLGVLARIDITPPLSPRKRDAVRRIHYDDSTKVLALTKNRFWETEDGIYGGGSVSDGALGSTWYPSDNVAQNSEVSRQPSVFLASYSWGQQARRMAIRENRDRTAAELATLHDCLNSSPELIERTASWSWGDHPWSAGAYSFFRPGEHAELHGALVEPDGRVLLAGEHASLTHSWIQGAFQSAVRAATTIVELEESA